MNPFLHLLKSISPDCREATRRQSEALDHPLPFLQRLGLQCHLLLCVWCRRYGSQIKFLRQAARKCDEVEIEPPGSAGARLSEEARTRIRKRLNQP